MVFVSSGFRLKSSAAAGATWPRDSPASYALRRFLKKKCIRMYPCNKYSPAADRYCERHHLLLAFAGASRVILMTGYSIIVRPTMATAARPGPEQTGNQLGYQCRSPAGE